MTRLNVVGRIALAVERKAHSNRKDNRSYEKGNYSKWKGNLGKQEEGHPESSSCDHGR